MSDPDDVLRQHQRKMQMHRQWVEEQHQALKALSGGLAIAGSATAAATNSVKGFVSSPSASSARNHVPSQHAQPSSPPSRYQTFGAHQPSASGSQYPHGGAAAYSSPMASSPVPLAPMLQQHPQQQQPPPPFSSVRRTPPGSSNHRNDVLDDEANFVSVNTGSPLAVYMRGSQWLKRKEQRMAEQRTLREQAELAQCTFAPNSSGGIGSPNVSASRSRPRQVSADRHSAAAAAAEEEGDHDLADGAVDDGEQDTSFQVADVAVGVMEHVERLDRARRLVREREERLNSIGSGWTPEPTSVEPFQLGYRVPSGSIRALRQPISAPHRSVIDPTVYKPFLGTTAPQSTASPHSASAENGGLPAPGSFSKQMRASGHVQRSSYAAQHGTPAE